VHIRNCDVLLNYKMYGRLRGISVLFVRCREGMNKLHLAGEWSWGWELFGRRTGGTSLEVMTEKSENVEFVQLE
jgi:hypothetical protein